MTARGSTIPQLHIIAAMDRKHAIGVDGRLPWHLPDDLKRFKRLTLGKPVLMGRKTADSLGRALPGRRNLVLTRGARVPFEGMESVRTIDEAIATAGSRALVVIGGGDVFALALVRATHMNLTFVDCELARADAWFPHVEWTGWREVARERHGFDAKHAVAFEFVDYVRAAF